MDLWAHGTDAAATRVLLRSGTPPHPDPYARGPQHPDGAPVPHGVHRTATDGDPLMTLCTVVDDLTADRVLVRGTGGDTAELPLSDSVRGVAPEPAVEPSTDA